MTLSGDSATRPPLRFREGQTFKGYAFGQPITIRLDSPEWVDYAGDPPFWTWRLTRGGHMAEDVLATEWELVDV